MNSLAKRSSTDLSKYNPDKGLKTVAVAEAAEKHFARAKDAGKLQAAIRAKLEAQAEFVYWWDTQAEKNKGAATKRGDRSVTALTLGVDGLPDKKTLSRWRQKLNDPTSFETTYQKACERYVKILEFCTGAIAGMNYPESNEWYTPAEYIEAARAVMGGIDTDPASSEIANLTVKASTFYTVDNDGIAQPWTGRVWLNPPYSGTAGKFIQRLAESVKDGETTQAVALVNGHCTDTEWFQPLWDALVCFTNHRINFISPTDSKPVAGSNHGSAIAYFGPHRGLFIQTFTPFGVVVERAK